MRRTITYAAVAVLMLPLVARAQVKRPLDHDVYDSWNRIQDRQISDDGRWVLYALVPQEGDAELQVRSLRSDVRYTLARGREARFSDDNGFVVFLIKPELALVREAKKEKKKDDEQPKDSLAILNLANGEVTRVERVKSFKLPEEAGGWVAYLLEKSEAKADTAEEEEEKGPEGEAEEEEKEEGEKEKEKKEGTVLVLQDLPSGEERRFESVTEYAFAEDGRRLVYAASSKDGSADGMYVVNVAGGTVVTLLAGEGSYKSAVFDDAGDQVAFLTNRDDYEADQPTFSLYHWRSGSDSARAVVAEGTAGVPDGWWVSEHGDVSFSDGGSKLFFGTTPRPAPEPEDETPDWEEVTLDVWNWKDPLLQPMQLVQRDDELKRSYRAVLHLDDDRVVQLATPDMPTATVGSKGDAEVALAVTNMPYRREISWDSPRYRDVYLVDVATGTRRLAQEKLRSTARLSPEAKFITWWDGHELAWFALDVNGGEPVNLTGEITHPVYNELDDRPMIPNPYGNGGWIEGDGWFLVYDKHDIWATDPTGQRAPRNITEGMGRRENLQFRYVSLDPDQDALAEGDPMLLRAFDLTTKDAGFYRDQVRGDREPIELVRMARRFGIPRKADDADVLMLTRESFQEFPDLWVSDLAFNEMRKVSEANPQQADFLWGTSELVYWNSTDGLPLQGILYKPEGFDLSQKYPMMVYFYEKMSNTLHSHRAPFPGGSSVNISFYVSRGYVVFVPDIHYRDGYPGESALNCVVPGVLSVVAKGFVDPDRIGVQGHSWGGYQIAYLVTRTNIFKAAEAGAPVANMTSAYGGIRWGSGMSRMFQYERTQSRLGGSLWEVRPRYIENSPLFWADKIETPVLMMHNDEDTAVPWYQGIEFFVALRRLAKPVWLLNYNGEPHGLRKHQNRKDWAVRMQQFFDHYLTDAPAPVSLAEGIPAVEKGKTLGLELVGGESRAVSGGGGRSGG